MSLKALVSLANVVSTGYVMRPSTKTLGWLMLAMCAAVAAVYVLVPASIGDDWPTEPFSASEWRQVPPTYRFRITKDLVRSRQLIGKSASEVETLLGLPSYRHPENAYWLYTVQDADTGVGGLNVVAQIRLTFGRGRLVEEVAIVAD